MAAASAAKPVKRSVETAAIPHKGGLLTTLVERLPYGILIQRANAEWKHLQGKSPSFTIRGGTVWVPNRELAEQTDGASKYMRCDDLYEALRLCIHTNNGYGTATNHEGSETRNLGKHVATARASAKAALGRKALDQDVRDVHDAIQRRQGGELVMKRNTHKRRAGAYLLAALETMRADTLGRRNSSAAAMRMGAGIGELIKRLLQVGSIDRRIEGRTQVLRDYIAEILQAYNALWDDLAGPEHFARGGKIPQALYWGDRARLEHATPLERHRGADEVGRIRSVLLEHRERIVRIHAAPFRRNAFHTLADIDAAIELCDITKLDDLKKRVVKLKNGMRWVYPLSYLHLVILLPLSMQIEYSKLVCREKNKAVRRKYQLTLDEYLVQFSGQFEPLLGEIDVFESKLKKCTDENLDTPVKAGVLLHLFSARASATGKKWLEAKRHLTAIANIL